MSRAILTQGLMFGDEGKGTTVDWLTRHYKSGLTVRYSGGPQCAHNVVTPEGLHHTFSQFGSGTFAGAKTFLGLDVLVNPISAVTEAKHLKVLGVHQDPLDSIYVDDNAIVTTPFHIAANRILERHRGENRHGSTGMGVGMARWDFEENPVDALLVEDLTRPSDDLEDLLMATRERMLRHLRDDHQIDVTSEAKDGSFLVEDSMIDDLLRRTLSYYQSFTDAVHIVDVEWLSNQMKNYVDTTIFEGAQGVLLDDEYGFLPHTTWGSCTFEGANDLLRAVAFTGDVQRLGIVRAYTTRHGAGPMPTEDPGFDSCSRHDHNIAGELQGNLRSGAFDFQLLHYALDVIGKLDGLVVTNLDRLKYFGGSAATAIPVCHRYESIDPAWHLTVRPYRGQEHHESLTKIISKAKPVYDEFDLMKEGELAYAKNIAQYAGVPLHGVSRGATWKEKEFL